MDKTSFLAGAVIFLCDALILWGLIRMMLGQLQAGALENLASGGVAVSPWVRVLISGSLLLLKTFFLLFATWLSLKKLGMDAGAFAGGAVLGLMIFIFAFWALRQK